MVGVRRSVAGVVLGVIAAGAWVAAPAVAAPAVAASVSLEQGRVASSEGFDAADASDSSTVVPIRATSFGMEWMGTVTRVARIQFVGDPRAVIYPGYYPDGTVIGPDKTPQPAVDILPSGRGSIWYDYDAPTGYHAFTQVVDGVASGSFGLYMTRGTELLDNFTVSVADIASGSDGVSTVSLQGDLPFWRAVRIEVVADGEVISAGDVDPEDEMTWALDVTDVPAGEHTWEVRLVSEGEIIMVRTVSVITPALETPIVHPAALTATGLAVLAIAGIAFVRRRRSV